MGRYSLLPDGSPNNLEDREVMRREVRCRGLVHQRWVFIAQMLFFCLSCILMWRGLKLSREAFATRAVNDPDFRPMWSPALEAVAGTGYLERFDGSFATSNRFKGAPNSEIDEAWAHLEFTEGGVISINESTLLAVNASREYSVKLAPEIGGGYMASIEVLHQLHCLNMLRQATYEAYYKDRAASWEDPPDILRHHLDHCIDNLRQKLMCEADTGILTYVWARDHPAPFPDFNVQHKCRSFEAVRMWVQEHQTFTPKNFSIQRQPGFKELESPP